MLDQAIRSHASDRRPEACRRSASENDALVLTQLQQTNRPISAYDIAARVSRTSSVMVPNQVYRTLARLMAQGRVVRIESLAAYFPAQEHGDICLICTQCHAVSFRSAPETVAMLGMLARGHGYAVRRTIIEASGKCPSCLGSGKMDRHKFGMDL